MVKTVACCPRCFSIIGLDVLTGNIIFNPGDSDDQPCPHLVCFYASLEVDRKRPDVDSIPDQDHAVDWLWEYGKGLRRVPTPFSHGEMLPFYLFDLGFGQIPRKLLPKAEFEIVGKCASDREMAREGSGEFTINQEGDETVTASLDGFVVFSSVPEQVMHEIARNIPFCTLG